MSSRMHTDSLNSLTFYMIRVQGLVELDPLWLDLVEALVRRETGEQVYGSALEFV